VPKVKKTPQSYKEITREDFAHREVEDRLKDYKTVYKEYADDLIQNQAARCQDCGIPFCHGFGCPLGNMIPDWNELVYKGLWKEALALLHKTNNFPEITGIVCPALCEEACTLNVGMEPVSIRNIELAIIEKGFENSWVVPEKPVKRTGKKVAIVGSGPAGLTAAQDLNRMGHSVTIFEKDAKVGGFLRYGIPDFKLEKSIIDRRVKILAEEGIEIMTGVNVGEDISAKYLRSKYDVVLLTCGSRDPRDLIIEGRNLDGIYFATEYLRQSNMRVDGLNIPKNELIDAKGKNVVVIGGGDTGSDCIGTARRQGAKNITQIEILPKPPAERADETPWPMYAKMLRTSSSHEEGCDRKWCVATKSFSGAKSENISSVEKISCVEVEWYMNEKKVWQMREKAGSEFDLKAELVLLAMGFVHPVHDKLLSDLEVEFDGRGNIKTDVFGYGHTNVPGVFAAGDAARGASLVVWAFNHGKEVSKMVDEYLLKK
jgi:glutamate synthase (NADPH) small chain